MNNVTIVGHPLVQHKLTEMRRKETQPPEFRRLLREISVLLAYEVTRNLPLATTPIETPLAAMRAPVLAGPRPCLVSILRSGNALLEGMLELLPEAVVGHIGLYRDHDTLEAVEYYFKVPHDIAQRFVIVTDPMLATAGSACAAVARLKQAGAKAIRFVCLLAAPEGLRTFGAAHPDVPVFTAVIDERLDENGYIVPGLGDAGDRLYGTK